MTAIGNTPSATTCSCSFTRCSPRHRREAPDLDQQATGLALPQECRPERRAVDFLAPLVDLRNLPGVGDVLERVRVEDDEIGALAGGKGAKAIELEQSRTCRRGRDYRLHGCHACRDHQLQLVVLAVA